MEALNRVDTQKGELSAKLENLIEKGKEVCDRLQDQTAAAAKATNEAIREHPYQAVGIALGVGVVLGLLVMWSRRD
jgi:ElaB/YqjD/DUF883 family membrane-anchored ribosome-binding protein